MENYENFWLENNKPERKVAVIKIKRQKPKAEAPRRFVVVKKQDLIARGPATSAPVGSTISFDPEITASPKWRSQFHYPDDGTSSGYMIKEGDYKFNIEL